MSNWRIFKWTGLFTLLGLGLATWLGWSTTHSGHGMLAVLFICAVLAVLEVSLSFDNAIINAKILERMSPVWQRRFLTWGIFIAVFGMRMIFPLMIVALAAGISPLSAFNMAIRHPSEYAHIMEGSRLLIDGFGGSFLMMVGLQYFFDAKKEVHWIGLLEKRLARWSSLKGIEVGLLVAFILLFAHLLRPAQSLTFMSAALMGLLTFLAMEVLGQVLDASRPQIDAAKRGGIGTFLYLEMLDASFSFDGVIGAFALSTNLFVIAIGLSIGALYVRSMTILLVERQTLGEYRFLEHGAFYAILLLAIIMFAQTIVEIPEVATGLVGAGLVILSLRSSVRYNAICHPKQ
ncbi:DUF475 domain-containing protein [Consotaella salsifontis]|uniref:Integral membrane protein, YkoY family n=1 Tax=Consotaella salsifontis TaxID=1365950 RepID=A0A1T4SXG7_9HYPH|nr:DUF475 domain-containing protein [Consotaella salsifontis]SKA32598.1 hypothetical protein SAMN05428963_11520 [Consotaella salsifontis]